MKNKNKAIIYAILGGWIGLHRFYLGQTGKGILYCILGLCFVSPILGILDGVSWMLNSQDNFDSKYNKQAIQREILNNMKNK